MFFSCETIEYTILTDCKYLRANYYIKEKKIGH